MKKVSLLLMLLALLGLTACIGNPVDAQLAEIDEQILIFDRLTACQDVFDGDTSVDVVESCYDLNTFVTWVNTTTFEPELSVVEQELIPLSIAVEKYVYNIVDLESTDTQLIYELEDEILNSEERVQTAIAAVKNK